MQRPIDNERSRFFVNLRILAAMLVIGLGVQCTLPSNAQAGLLSGPFNHAAHHWEEREAERLAAAAMARHEAHKLEEAAAAKLARHQAEKAEAARLTRREAQEAASTKLARHEGRKAEEAAGAKAAQRTEAKAFASAARHNPELKETAETRLTAELAAHPGRAAEIEAVADDLGITLEKSATRRMNPASIRFSQDSAGENFTAGGSVENLAEGLRSGATRAEDIPPIRLVERDGQLYTLDNRRLEAFRQAGVEVPYRMATPEEAADEGWKFTTKNGGTSIRMRGKKP